MLFPTTKFLILGGDLMSLLKCLATLLLVLALTGSALGVAITYQFQTDPPEPQPVGLTYDGNYLWVMGLVSGELYKYSTDGTLIATYLPIPTLTWVTGLAYISDEYSIYALRNDYPDLSVYSIFLFNFHTENLFSVSISYPNGLAYDGDDGLWIGSSNYDRYVYGLDMNGVEWTSFPTLAKYPYGVMTDGTYVYVLGYEDGKIWKYDMDGNTIYEDPFPLDPLFEVGEEHNYCGNLVWAGDGVFYQSCLDTFTIYEINLNVEVAVQPNSIGYIKALMR